mmetsp:Transcript_4195/g.13138  ORF Transcript_4195/g.13138 Transcript_4195/m.13138 type:complete len:332 (-) Transcript_4195:195-1190(-)
MPPNNLGNLTARGGRVPDALGQRLETQVRDEDTLAQARNQLGVPKLQAFLLPLLLGEVDLCVGLGKACKVAQLLFQAVHTRQDLMGIQRGNTQSLDEEVLQPCRVVSLQRSALCLGTGRRVMPHATAAAAPTVRRAGDKQQRLLFKNDAQIHEAGGFRARALQEAVGCKAQPQHIFIGCIVTAPQCPEDGEALVRSKVCTHAYVFHKALAQVWVVLAKVNLVYKLCKAGTLLLLQVNTALRFDNAHARHEDSVNGYLHSATAVPTQEFVDRCGQPLHLSSSPGCCSLVATLLQSSKCSEALVGRKLTTHTQARCEKALQVRIVAAELELTH